MTDELATIRREVVRRCVEQARLGHDNRSLRLMGFADGAINEARRFIEADNKPYNYNNPPVGQRAQEVEMPGVTTREQAENRARYRFDQKMENDR